MRPVPSSSRNLKPAEKLEVSTTLPRTVTVCPTLSLVIELNGTTLPDTTGVSVGWVWGFGQSAAHHNRITDNHILQLNNGIWMNGCYGSPVMRNNIIRGNVGQGIYIGCYTNPTIGFNTLHANGTGINLQIGNGYTATVSSNIVSSNNWGIIRGSGTCNLSYNDLWDNAVNYSGMSAGATDLRVDPAFYFSALGDRGSLTSVREENLTVGHLFQAAFAGMADMPHVSAIITNLGEELTLVDRMQDALQGEMTRRQELLRAAGNFANVTDYEKARTGGRTDLEPLPALLIVADEFSELLSARPDFADLFVAIGRLGRSLQMHLLLSSQRLEEGRLRAALIANGTINASVGQATDFYTNEFFAK